VLFVTKLSFYVVLYNRTHVLYNVWLQHCTHIKTLVAVQPLINGHMLR